MRNPLYEDLCQVLGTYTVSFHTPGHKYKAMQDLAMMRIDTTEIDGTDHLHNAKGILKDAQERVAKAYAAKESFFLINGTTGGIHAMIKAAVPKGKKLVIQRDSHKCVFNACALFDIPVEILEPYYDRTFGITKGFRYKTLERLLASDESIAAVLITSPNYYGLTLDIQRIAILCHEVNIPLLVDEAHGAHFEFSKYMPKSALSQGADLVCQSTHKTLPAMTQASLMHVGSDRIAIDCVKMHLEILQSSSPSYVLMNALDYAIHFAVNHGPRLLDALYERVSLSRKKLSRKIGLVDLQLRYKKYNPDPLRWMISADPFKMSGYELADLLRRHYGIQMELASQTFVLAIVSMLNSPSEIDVLESALLKIALETHDKEIPQVKPLLVKEKYKPVLTLAEALEAKSERLHLDVCQGRILSQAIIPYPPGIPMLLPGEELTVERIQKIKACSQLQEVNGVSELCIQVVSQE